MCSQKIPLEKSEVNGQFRSLNKYAISIKLNEV